jgi:GTP-binding protein HflX
LTRSNGGSGGPENVIVAGLILRDLSRGVIEDHLDELTKLVEAAGGMVVGSIIAKRPSPDPATYLGKGKAAEIEALVRDKKASLVVFDDDLSPAQIRNLEAIIPCKIIDRSALILDIFARRARTREARTQVELAQMKYLLPRLTRQWSHLSRQAGGIGTRGVGETQLEIDRRIVRDRIARLGDDLTKIERTRETQRKSRKRAFTVALVGYTNAGKSTLFNRLTHGNVEALDQLFATLDAKLQRTYYPMPRETVMIDTVGFIRKLPHHLVASFRSTMEEAVSADLVLHVIDASHPQLIEQRDVADEVLADLGVEPERIVEVYNKIDRLDGPLPAFSRRDWVTVSALTGQGIERLMEMIRERELAGGEVRRLSIPSQDSRVLARLHDLAEVHEQISDDDVVHVTAWIPTASVHLFERYVS